MILGLILAMGAILHPTSVPKDAAVPAPKHFRLEPLGGGAYACVAAAGDRESVGNAGFIVGSAGVLAVDAFATEAAAEELLRTIRAVTRAPVRWVVNTHYHLDHVGGDRVFVRAGAVVLGHENLRAWIRTENLKWRAEVKPEEKAMLASLTLPDVTYRDSLTVWPGDEKVRILALPGHTGGDSIVVASGGNVVFAGDLFWNATVPNMIDADTKAWVRTLDSFLLEHGQSTFVPGHGDVGHALNVRYFRDYVAGLRQTVERAMERGQSGKVLLDAVLPLHRARFGAWTWFDQFAAKNIEWAEQEMRGTKRYAPTPAP